MAVESAIQDRWLPLIGEGSGELRVRVAAVPGAPDSPAVQQMVALFTQVLDKASTATLQVKSGESWGGGGSGGKRRGETVDEETGLSREKLDGAHALAEVLVRAPSQSLTSFFLYPPPPLNTSPEYLPSTPHLTSAPQVVVLAARNLPPRQKVMAMGLRDAYCK
jgi:hypothetical protein